MARLRVGATLQEARERLGLSVDEVAVRLKFAPRQITALEEENFEQLPESAFLRGFVRSYARLLQIDEAPLLDALPGTPARAAGPAMRGSKEDVLPGNSGTYKQNLIWLAGALAVAVTIGVLAWKYDTGEAMSKPASGVKPTPEAQGGGANPAANTPQANPEVPAATQPAASSMAAPAAKDSGTEAAAPRPSIATAAKPAPQAAHTLPASSVAASGASTPRKPRPARMLRLEFDEDSWVEVKDGSGKTLLSMLGKQGTSQSVSGPTPLSVTIGNAKGVRAYYKDQPLDLETSADQNVARLKLE